MGKPADFIKQFLRFSVVGITAYLIDYGLMLLLTEVFGVPYMVSTTVSYVISIIYNYAMSMRYVYSHKENMSLRREFIIFFFLAVVGLLLNDLLMWVGTDILGIDYRITKLVVGIIVSIYNFFSRKFFLDGGEKPRGVQRIEQATGKWRLPSSELEDKTQENRD